MRASHAIVALAGLAAAVQSSCTTAGAEHQEVVSPVNAEQPRTAAPGKCVPEASSPDINDVAIEELLDERGHAHDGELIRVRGVLRFGYEATALYASKGDYETANRARAVRISLRTFRDEARWSACGGVEVAMEGMYEAFRPGYLNFPRSGFFRSLRVVK
jgi:hypothetical protein